MLPKIELKIKKMKGLKTTVPQSIQDFILILLEKLNINLNFYSCVLMESVFYERKTQISNIKLIGVYQNGVFISFFEEKFRKIFTFYFPMPANFNIRNWFQKLQEEGDKMSDINSQELKNKKEEKKLTRTEKAYTKMVKLYFLLNGVKSFRLAELTPEMSKTLGYKNVDSLRSIFYSKTSKMPVTKEGTFIIWDREFLDKIRKDYPERFSKATELLENIPEKAKNDLMKKRKEEPKETTNTILDNNTSDSNNDGFNNEKDPKQEEINDISTNNQFSYDNWEKLLPKISDASRFEELSLEEQALLDETFLKMLRDIEDRDWEIEELKQYIKDLYHKINLKKDLASNALFRNFLKIKNKHDELRDEIENILKELNELEDRMQKLDDHLESSSEKIRLHRLKTLVEEWHLEKMQAIYQKRKKADLANNLPELQPVLEKIRQHFPDNSEEALTFLLEQMQKKYSVEN